MRCWAVDAGGSNTTAMVLDGDVWSTGSVNHASVGAATADARLRTLFADLADRIGPGPASGWFATATVGADAGDSEVDRLAELAATAGLTGTLVISRDIVPLLVSEPLNGRGVVVVCGTGSGFLAGDGTGRPVSVGGCEYLGSDEGSAYAIGLGGLRGGVRAADGRGQASLLEKELAAPGIPAGVPVAELARRLAALPYPKASVAALAPAVCRCWLAGDTVAGEVIATALDDLVAGIRAARDRARLAHGSWSAVLSGGVLRGCSRFAGELADRVAGELGASCRPVVVGDPVEAVLSAAVAYRGVLPDGLAGWALARPLRAAA